MNKANAIIQITSSELDHYRNSISRKAFIRAMEQVAELVLGPGEQPMQVARPGLDLIRSPDLSVEQLAQQICGACPPFPLELADYPCHDQTCQNCWQSWLKTGKPPQTEKEARL